MDRKKPRIYQITCEQHFESVCHEDPIWKLHWKIRDGDKIHGYEERVCETIFDNAAYHIMRMMYLKMMEMLGLSPYDKPKDAE